MPSTLNILRKNKKNADFGKDFRDFPNFLIPDFSKKKTKTETTENCQNCF